MIYIETISQQNNKNRIILRLLQFTKVYVVKFNLNKKFNMSM